MTRLDRALAEELARLDDAALRRRLRAVATASDAEVEVDGRRLLLLSSNNYLGLATHPAVRAAAAAAIERWGCGTGSSRLIAGHLELHAATEAKLAAFKGTEAALLFPSGYQANVGTIAALVGTGDHVYSDALNHASIIDGCRLSRATVHVYPHRDVRSLEGQLAATAPGGRRLIVTDSLFSMDGDRAPLRELAALADHYHSSLMIDEAHASGVLGPAGAGLAQAEGVAERVDVHMGTLGKALGGAGAYVAGSRLLIEWLLNRARSFVFTTGLAPAAVAAAGAALDVVAAEPERRRALVENATRLRAGLRDIGLDARGDDHIVPVVVGDNRRTLVFAEALRARGVLAQAIRPPTVPPGTARLRVTPMATHTPAQLERARAAFADAACEAGIPRVTEPARLVAWDHRHLWHPFTQMADWLAEEPLVIAEAQGTTLIDVHGRRYLDGVSSLWCNVHGHRHPVLDAALREQLDRVAHSTLLGLANVPSIELARALIDVVPAGLTRVFYSDAGATAVEAALRIALQYHQLRGDAMRTRFASLVEAYHGDTLGAVGVGYSESFHRFVAPAVASAVRLTPPHVFRWQRGMDAEGALAAALAEAEETLAAHGSSLAAVVVEPLVQGAAGMWIHPPAYLAALHALARRHGTLLIADEVATGFGRTGRMFACEHAGITPDILCLAKGISGGYLPLAATLTTETVFETFLAPYESFRAFFHGHTYTGNPLACAVGLASLRVFREEQTLARLAPKIARLRERLHADVAPLPHVGDVRQHGVMVGIELVADREQRTPYPPAARIGQRVVQAARARGVIIRPLGSTIVLMPPLAIATADLDTLVDVTRDAIEEATTP